MTDPLRAEQPRADRDPLAIVEAVMDICHSDEQAVTWLWSLRRNGWATGDVDSRELLNSMQAPREEGGRGLARSTAYNHAKALQELHAWVQLGAETWRIVAPASAADAVQNSGRNPPFVPISIDHGSKGSRVREGSKAKGNTSAPLKGSMGRPEFGTGTAPIGDVAGAASSRLTNHDPGDRAAEMDRIIRQTRGVLETCGDTDTSEVVYRKIAEMVVQHGDAGQRGLEESLRAVANADSYVTGPRAMLLGCLGRRGMPYHARDGPK
ncbi:MAG TPA: hypothetical protein VNH11_24730 [Pirellulales bacterium]|nr:hypothetical protein [Pirellulales bacterium]